MRFSSDYSLHFANYRQMRLPASSALARLPLTNGGLASSDRDDIRQEIRQRNLEDRSGNADVLPAMNPYFIRERDTFDPFPVLNAFRGRNHPRPLPTVDMRLDGETYSVASLLIPRLELHRTRFPDESEEETMEMLRNMALGIMLEGGEDAEHANDDRRNNQAPAEVPNADPSNINEDSGAGNAGVPSEAAREAERHAREQFERHPDWRVVEVQFGGLPKIRVEKTETGDLTVVIPPPERTLELDVWGAVDEVFHEE